MSKDKHRAKARRLAILRQISWHGRIVHSKRRQHQRWPSENYLYIKDKDLQRLIKEGHVKIERRKYHRAWSGNYIKRTVAVPTRTWRNW